MILIFLLSVVALLSFLFWFFRKNSVEKVETPVEEKVEEQVEEKVEVKITEEDLLREEHRRLNEIKSPDSDKPFAKISKPDISEIPIEMVPDAEEKPKRRGRKKKST
jgi:hypothetical protein